MLEWIPKLECPNPSCIAGKHLQLPYSNLQQISGNQPDWPKDDWQAFVVCHHCGSGRVYSKTDVRWGLSPSFAPDIWESMSFRQVEVKCDHADCKFPIRIHMQAEKPWREQTSRLKLHPVVGNPGCAAGHSVRFPLVYLNSRDLPDFGEATP